MDTLNKSGIIKNITKNELKIEILSCSACSSCVVKNYCTGFEAKQKEIVIKNKNVDNFQIGEEVLVSIDERQAFKSIFLVMSCELFSLLIVVVSFKYLLSDCLRIIS